MKFFLPIKYHRTVVVVILASYALAYGIARYSQMLIHRVSHAGDVYYHVIDASSVYAWTPVGFVVPVSYWIFTPLRWTEVIFWRFIPRTYEIH
jgi:hypothetical protein